MIERNKGHLGFFSSGRMRTGDLLLIGRTADHCNEKVDEDQEKGERESCKTLLGLGNAVTKILFQWQPKNSKFMFLVKIWLINVRPFRVLIQPRGLDSDSSNFLR